MQNNYKNIYNGKFTNVFFNKIDNTIVKQYTNITLYRNERYIYKQLSGKSYIAKLYKFFKKDKLYNIVLEEVGIDLNRFKKLYYNRKIFLLLM